MKLSRQNLTVVIATIVAADVAATGVAVNVQKLENGMIPITGRLVVEEAFNAGTSMVLDIGRAAGSVGGSPVSASANAYLNDGNLAAAGNTAFTALPGVVGDDTGGIQLTVTPTIVGAAPTTGKAYVVVEYAIAGREHF